MEVYIAYKLLYCRCFLTFCYYFVLLFYATFTSLSYFICDTYFHLFVHLFNHSYKCRTVVYIQHSTINTQTHLLCCHLFKFPFTVVYFFLTFHVYVCVCKCDGLLSLLTNVTTDLLTVLYGTRYM